MPPTVTPGSLQAELNSATALLRRGRLPQAATAAQRLKRSHAGSAAVWALASEVSLRQGRLRPALDEIDRAVELDGGNARRHVQRARCAVLAGLIPQASASVEAALARGIDDADEFMMLASVLVRCDDHEGALRLYRKAEAIAPDRNELHRGMATVLRFLGRLDEAETACDRAVACDPHDYEMLNLRSSLRRQSPQNNHVQELSGLLSRGVKDWRGAVQVCYALAKEFEDLERYDDAFRHLAQGASLRRRHTKYNVVDDIRIFGAIKKACTAEAMQRAEGRGDSSVAPIFVLGLPRTGSTLVERIISSHSLVQSAGELNDFAIELLKLVGERRNGRQPDRLQLPAAALEVDMGSLGRNYIAAARERVPGEGRFIDKLPLNSLYLGLIRLALPNARAVHVERHPVDTCLAMYKYLFKNAYPFSYDLDELATYYIEYHRLMAHWRSVLPDGWLYDIRYEDLVGDQRGATERLLDYLGLPWEDACLDFHLNVQPSTTGSASQVRQRLYGSSVGRWRAFENHLGPLIGKLAEAGITVD